MKFTSSMWLSCLLILLSGIASARAETLLLSGFSRGATSHYGFAGAILPLGSGELGSGFGARLWVDYLGYEYKAGNSTIEASGWGGALSGVYQLSGDWGWSNLAAGIQLRDTELSPDDPGNRARGFHGYLALGVDGGYNIDPHWRVSGAASYTAGLNGYRGHAQLSRQIWDRIRLGASRTYQGDDTYHEESASVVATFGVTNDLEVHLNVGKSSGSGGSGLLGGMTLVLVTH